LALASAMQELGLRRDWDLKSPTFSSPPCDGMKELCRYFVLEQLLVQVLGAPPATLGGGFWALSLVPSSFLLPLGKRKRMWRRSKSLPPLRCRTCDHATSSPSFLLLLALFPFVLFSSVLFQLLLCTFVANKRYWQLWNEFPI